MDELNSEIRKQARFTGGDSIGKVSPDPVLRYASGDKRAEEARKNDRRKARED